MSVIRNYLSLHRLLLIAGDAVLAAVSFWLSCQIRFGSLKDLSLKLKPLDVKIGIFTIVLIACSFWVELYNDEHISAKDRTLFARSCGAITAAFLILSVLFYILPTLEIGRGVLSVSLVLFLFAQFLWHRFCQKCEPFAGFAKRVLIFGTGPAAQLLGNLIYPKNHRYVLAGYINCVTEPSSVPQGCVVGDSSCILEASKKERAHQLVISITEKRGALPLQDILACKLMGVDVVDAPSFYEELTGKLLLEHIQPSWLIFGNGFKMTPIKRFYKLVLDQILSLVTLVVTLPVFPLIALLIKIDSPGPVFFKQSRVGQYQREFTLYKFRTMVDRAEKHTGPVWAKKEDPRITRVGRFLRKTRLDELPQLLNVLKGDMSLIGPRPERPEFVDELKRQIPFYAERHFAKPGITGWAQVRYPYGASVEDAIEKLRFDLFYIKHLSFFFDVLIIIETIKVALFGRGAR